MIRVGGLTRPRTHCDDCGVLLSNANTRSNLDSVTKCGKCYLTAKQKQREKHEVG